MDSSDKNSLPKDLKDSLRRQVAALDRELVDETQTCQDMVECIQHRARTELAARAETPTSHRARVRQYTVAAAVELEVPPSFLNEAYKHLPVGHSAALDDKVITLLTEENANDPAHQSLAITFASGGGELPRALTAKLDTAPPLSRLAWLRYIHARNHSDHDTLRTVLTTDLATGCPASLLLHLKHTPLPDQEILTWLDSIDLARLTESERWGDLTALAEFSATKGWLHRAHQIATLIPDHKISAAEIPSTPRANHHALADWCTLTHWVLLPPLALIDLLAGDHERAMTRAESAQAAARTSGAWQWAGHQALADWVRSRAEPDPATRRAHLERIEARHTWLGVLQAQIYHDLSDIAATTGQPDQQQIWHNRALQAMHRPHVDLHFGTFPHDELLHQLPVAKQHPPQGPNPPPSPPHCPPPAGPSP